MKRIMNFISILTLVFALCDTASAGAVQSHAGHGAPSSWIGIGLTLGFGLILNESSLGAIFTSFKTIFQEAFDKAIPQYDKVSLVIPSSAKIETYDWLGTFPKMRQWLDERLIKNLKAQGWTIKNLDWESTIAVDRNDIVFDQYGVFKPIVGSMGAAARLHPDEIVFPLLTGGFATKAYDGKNFFDTTHSFGSNKGTAKLTADAAGVAAFGAAVAQIRSMKDDQGRPLFSGAEKLTLVVPPQLESAARTVLHAQYVSVTGGSTQNNVWMGAADMIVTPQLTNALYWFILVDFMGIRPLIFQQAKVPEFVSFTTPQSSPEVFLRKKFLYGVDSIDNAGYGLPQLAFGSDGSA